MLGSTDIPDWCWTEACGVPPPEAADAARDPRAADPTRIPVADAGALAAMAAASPIRYVGAGAVRAPTLLLVGARDRRVPKDQALEYWYALKEAGVPTKCVVAATARGGGGGAPAPAAQPEGLTPHAPLSPCRRPLLCPPAGCCCTRRTCTRWTGPPLRRTRGSTLRCGWASTSNSSPSSRAQQLQLPPAAARAP